MPRTRPPQSLADILPQVISKMQGEGRPSLETIRKEWRRLAGLKAAHHSWPKSLTRGQLLIEVENSGWMYTLNLMREKLLDGLAGSLGPHQMKELRFRIGDPKDA